MVTIKKCLEIYERSLTQKKKKSEKDSNEEMKTFKMEEKQEIVILKRYHQRSKHVLLQNDSICIQMYKGIYQDFGSKRVDDHHHNNFCCLLKNSLKHVFSH